MFKLALALCVIAAAAESEAPVISMSLNYDGSNVNTMSCVKNDATKIDTCDIQCHQTVDDASGVGCKRPNINAWDHHDGDVTAAIQFKTKAPGGTFDALATMQQSQPFANIDFDKCGRYTIELFVADASGNNNSNDDVYDEGSSELDQINVDVYDKEAPSITWLTTSRTHIEATCVAGTAAWALPQSATCTDNNVGQTIAYSGLTTKSKCVHTTEVCWTNTATCTDAASSCSDIVPTPANNVDVQSHEFCIADTVAPECQLKGFSNVFAECGYDYNYANGGAFGDNVVVDELTCTDATSQPLTTDTFGQLVVTRSAIGDMRPFNLVTSVTYTATDTWNHASVPVTRAITVEDTQAPIMTISNGVPATNECKDGDCAWHVMCVKGVPVTEVTTVCADLCDTAAPSVTSAWKGAALTFNSPASGVFVHQHQCTDAAGNTEERSVIYECVDKDMPTCAVLGDAAENWEATHSGLYTDAGATCALNGGDLSHLVKTSGDVVNLSKLGTYDITFKCTNPHTTRDSSPQTATCTREVVVRDTTCPVITLVTPAPQEFTIEAGFPYVDAGATASDSFDGDITSLITTDGTGTMDMFNTAALADAKSCMDIPLNVQTAPAHHTLSGVDVICYKGSTFAAMPAGHSHAVPLDATTFDQMSAAGFSACEDFGMLTPSADDFADNTLTKYLHADYNDIGGLKVEGVAFESYPCKFTSDSSASNQHLVWLRQGGLVKVEGVASAEGTYYITYSVTDRQNVPACHDITRTIHVDDSLPPVITLKHQTGYATSQITATSANSVWNAGVSTTPTNPANAVNPFMLMAEQSSVNGWMVGAVASFVAGVALLGYTSKTETYSVPV